ncbi:MAG: hypothetical protein H0V91_00375, partial [Flavisolibacter sp.]|nr:hypothetical protein [Flavisolibacter sp.]
MKIKNVMLLSVAIISTTVSFSQVGVGASKSVRASAATQASTNAASRATGKVSGTAVSAKGTTVAA